MVIINAHPPGQERESNAWGLPGGRGGWLSFDLTATLIEANGYETRQSSLLYVFVLVFGLDSAQNTIVVYSVLKN